MERGLEGCWACGELDGCRKGLLAKSKPRGFSLFVRRYGMQALLDRLERNEQAGVVYHRTGVVAQSVKTSLHGLSLGMKLSRTL